MADEQYAWLDKEAAEKLLRGDPVVPAEGRPRQDAERLAAALDAVSRAALPAAGELHGEAAALAAFRAAPRRPRPAATHPAAAHAADGDDSGTAVLAPVHLGRTPATGTARPRGHRPYRWSRPLRFGLAASLACCAIGGVAVAAGSGVLPVPFGRHDPSPATSVSAAASPEELGSGAVAGGRTIAPTPPGTPTPDAPTPGSSPGDDTAGPDDDTPRGGHDGEDGPQDTGSTGDGDGGGPSGGDGRDSGADTADDHPGKDSADPGRGNGRSGSNGGATGWYARTVAACRDYRAGRIDDERRDRLEALAKGARNLDRFCDRMLGDQDGQGARENGGPPGRENADQDDEASAPLPSIRFTESPGPSTAAIAPDPVRTGEGASSETPRPTAAAAAR